jgi:hypothetical protein
MSTPDPMLSDAAAVAHGALVSLAGGNGISDYLSAAVLDRPEPERAAFVYRIAAAALVQHASTLAHLVELGVLSSDDVHASLRDYGLARAGLQ